MDIVCLSHLRWDFVFQRPQHLLTRAARDRRVFYVEEPQMRDGAPALNCRTVTPSLHIITPQLPSALSPDERHAQQGLLLQALLAEHDVTDYGLWYYTPMALAFTHQLAPCAVVYDCMDELSAFAGAPPELRRLEQELFAKADVVFTGGHSLYEAKRAQHENVHAFPSSVDVAHFRRARRYGRDVHDQAHLPHPRIGFYGVIDERMDYSLLQSVAAARPSWQLVMIGPTAKIDPAALPHAPNIHYLGSRSYDCLPDYLAGWDVAMLPFARNEATRFISPTKTPEYLAAGLPVVSTSIRDVVRPYGELGLAHIADSVEEFVSAIEQALCADRVAHRLAADAFLRNISWDRTWNAMCQQLANVAERRMTRV